MFHSSKEGLPSYLEDNFKQLRMFNPEIPVYFLTDREWLSSPLFKKYLVIPLSKDLFYSCKIKHFELRYQKDPSDFWTITTTRLIYIENFLKEYNLRDVYHFENDVLLYFNLSKFDCIFKKLYDSMAITVGGPDKAMTGFIYINSHEKLAGMTSFFIDVLKAFGVKGIKDRYKTDMVNEMTLIRAFSKDHPREVSFLPILPFGEFSTNFSEFDSIFDPASWGQFVGGTQSEGPGAKPTDHYIGQLLLHHPEYTVVWRENGRGLKIPYFSYDEKEVKINNLHIHSKKLSKYLS
jgi:hypothetical protein